MLNWNSSPDCTFHLTIQCFLPILSSILFVQHIYQGHQMIGSVDCSEAGGAEYSVTGGAACFGDGSAECFGAAAYFGGEGAEYFVGTSLVALSAYHCPNLPCALPHFCKWGNVVPMNNLPQPA